MLCQLLVLLVLWLIGLYQWATLSLSEYQIYKCNYILNPRCYLGLETQAADEEDVI